jgi:hypothetical protein
MKCAELANDHIANFVADSPAKRSKYVRSFAGGHLIPKAALRLV